MLGVSRGTVYRWVAEKRIPHVRAVGAIRFDLDQLGQWIAQHSIPEETQR
jgi:excisionase family DNA binding protein